MYRFYRRLYYTFIVYDPRSCTILYTTYTLVTFFFKSMKYDLHIKTSISFPSTWLLHHLCNKFKLKNTFIVLCKAFIIYLRLLISYDILLYLIFIYLIIWISVCIQKILPFIYSRYVKFFIFISTSHMLCRLFNKIKR